MELKKEFRIKFDNKIDIIRNKFNHIVVNRKCISDTVPSGWIKNLTNLEIPSDAQKIIS